MFGNRDDGWDIIEKGAFKKFRKKRNGTVRLMAYHDSRQIIGEVEYKQDDRGLKVNGTLNFDLPHAAGVWAGMKDGSLDAMSVGFNIQKNGSRWDEDTLTRFISKAELFEVSIVPFGMNDKARITNVKGSELQTPRAFERFLRDHGFSRSQSEAITAKGFRAGQGEPDDATRGNLALANLIANSSLLKS